MQPVKLPPIAPEGSLFAASASRKEDKKLKAVVDIVVMCSY